MRQYAMHKPYQSIFFDADETLFHFNAQTCLERSLEYLEISYTNDELRQFRHTNQQLWQRYQRHEITMRELLDLRFAPLRERSGLNTDTLSKIFFNEAVLCSELIPGASELIKTLSGKIPLVLLTNGFKDMQLPRLQKHGLESCFDWVITSEEVGLPKPHRSMFDHAVAKLSNIPRSHILMVGDSLEADILGGHQAELDTCWFNPSTKPRHSKIKPDYQVSCLHQLRVELGDLINEL